MKKTTAKITLISRIFFVLPALIFLLNFGTRAATITVVNSNNEGAGSLRQAILDAAPGDTIDFDVQPGEIFTVALPIELVIDKNIAIKGPDPVRLILTGLNLARVLRIMPGVTVTLDGLTVADGKSSSISGNIGGNILNAGNLTIQNCIVSGGEASSGGGIYNNGGILRVTNSTIKNGAATNSGAGIFNSLAGSALITNSAVQNNTAVRNGGGIANNGSLTIVNTTVAHNIANRGAAVSNLGTFVSTNSTIAFNELSFDVSDMGAGGINAAGTETLTNTLVTGNLTTPTGLDEIGGLIETASNNLIADPATSGGIVHGVNGNIVGNGGVGILDPFAGMIFNGGGVTANDGIFYLPAAGSPAINAGSNALAVDAENNLLTTDQRGVGFPRIVGAAVDIGAIEQAALYNFSGFLQPVDNLPAVNITTAGSSIPVKFSLGGNKGLDIFAAGYPRSMPVACENGEAGSTIEETVAAGGSALTYDAALDQYKYVWKTERSWRGTCRLFVLKLNDGSEHPAKFRFR
jgi:hypothetical protein